MVLVIISWLHYIMTVAIQWRLFFKIQTEMNKAKASTSRRETLREVAALYTWPWGMVMAAGVTMETSGVLKKVLTGVPISWAC